MYKKLIKAQLKLLQSEKALNILYYSAIQCVCVFLCTRKAGILMVFGYLKLKNVPKGKGISVSLIKNGSS